MADYTRLRFNDRAIRDFVQGEAVRADIRARADRVRSAFDAGGDAPAVAVDVKDDTVTRGGRPRTAVVAYPDSPDEYARSVRALLTALEAARG